MSRYARKVDDNQGEVVAALRAIGCSVFDLSAVGGGLNDLLVGWRGRNVLIEVKDGAKAPSRQKLTPQQMIFRAEWRGQYGIARTVDEAIAIVQQHTLHR